MLKKVEIEVQIYVLSLWSFFFFLNLISGLNFSFFFPWFSPHNFVFSNAFVIPCNYCMLNLANCLNQAPSALVLVLAELHRACIYTVPKHIQYSAVSSLRQLRLSLSLTILDLVIPYRFIVLSSLWWQFTVLMNTILIGYGFFSCQIFWAFRDCILISFLP